MISIAGTVSLEASDVIVDSRPNIVLITADDLGCELGCYGDKIATTPNLDSLYRDGVRFDRVFVTSASCGPSQSSIFTGKYPHENGQIGLSHRCFSMHAGRVSFPALLKHFATVSSYGSIQAMIDHKWTNTFGNLVSPRGTNRGAKLTDTPKERNLCPANTLCFCG